MLKKLLLAGGGVALLLAFFFGRDAASYVSTTVGWLHDSVKESVPIAFELERAERMISDLTPEIRRNMHLIAREEVEVERLDRRVDALGESQKKDQSEILRLQRDLDTGDSYFVYRQTSYTASQVRTDLVHRFERFKTSEATHQNLQRILAARQQSLAAARQKLEGMLSAKRQLEVEVANLEARLKMVEVAQTTSDFNFDDSHLARTRDMINEIQTRIEVAERMVSAESIFQDEIPLDEEVEGDITDQITEYFSRHPQVELVAEAE